MRGAHEVEFRERLRVMHKQSDWGWSNITQAVTQGNLNDDLPIRDT